MTPDIPILIAGTGELTAQNHPNDQWLPALPGTGLRATGVWVPDAASAAERARCERLADDWALPLRGGAPDLAGVRGVLSCLDGPARTQLLRAAEVADVAVLQDKPSLDNTASLRESAAAAPAVRLLIADHPREHPSAARLLSAIAAGEIGLLRSLHLDLVVADGDGPCPVGELSNLLVYQLGLLSRATGPGTAQARAVRHESAAGRESWSVLGQTHRDVVFGLHLSRTDTGAGQPETLVNRIRAGGSHGSMSADLTGPALTVRRPGAVVRHPFGPSSVSELLGRFHAMLSQGAPGQGWTDTLNLAQNRDELARSARADQLAQLTW